MQKLVVIPSSGHIHVLSGIMGPINTPFYLSTDQIFELLNTGKQVSEVLEDNSRLPLTLDNYKNDNSIASTIHTTAEKTEAVAVGQEKKKELNIETTLSSGEADAPVESTKTETKATDTKANDTSSTNNTNTSYKNSKKR